MTPEEALQHPWLQTQDPPAGPPQPLPAVQAGWSPRSALPPANWLSVGSMLHSDTLIILACCTLDFHVVRLGVMPRCIEIINMV